MLAEHVENEHPAAHGDDGGGKKVFPVGYEIRHDVPQDVVTASLRRPNRLEVFIGGGVLDEIGWSGSHMHLTLLQDAENVAPCIVQDEMGTFAYSTSDGNGYGLRPPVQVTFHINKAIERAFMKAGVNEGTVELKFSFLDEGNGLVLDLKPLQRGRPAPETSSDVDEETLDSLPSSAKPSILRDIARDLGDKVEVPVYVLLGMGITLALLLAGQAIRAKSDFSMNWAAYEQTTAMRDLDRSIRDLRDLESNFRPRPPTYGELPDFPLAPLEQGRPVQDLPPHRLYEAPNQAASDAKPAISTGAK